MARQINEPMMGLETYKINIHTLGNKYREETK